MERAEIQTRIDGLRRDRGAATLAGKKYDSTVITELEDRLQALDDAGAVEAARQREAAQAARQKRLKEHRAELKALIASYLEGVREAEQHARAEAAAISRLLDTASAMARVSHAISGKPAPIPVGIFETENRLACRHAAVMGEVPGHRYRLGPLEWPSSHYKADDDWHAREVDLLKRHVEPLVNEED